MTMEKAEPMSGEAHDKLYSRINFSIEALYPNIRKAFLDIVSYYDIGTEWKSIKRLVDHKHLKILHQRALVQKTVKSSSQPSLVEIHDVIKALAGRMINDDTHELRITGMDNLERQYYVIWEKVVALKGVSLKACMLKQMPLLRFLKDVYVEGEGKEAQLRHLSVVRHLTSRTGKLFNLDECVGLKEVYWRRAVQNGADLELLRHKKELEVLHLDSWPQLKNVHAIETLTCLKELALFRCTEISYLPEGIGSLTKLEKLYLWGCENLQSLLHMLTSLSQLDLSDCKTLKSIEAVTTLTRLTQLDLSHCKTLTSIEAVTMLTRLTEINLNGCESLQMLPEGFSRLTRLTTLYLRGTSLNSLQEIKSFTGLKLLALSKCEGLYSLMEEGTFSMLGMLTAVEVSWCRCLQYLPQSITSLTSLETLSLEGCGSLQFLPDELTSLTGLKQLTLTEWKSVQSLPQGITSLMCLNKLTWWECNSLTALPRGVSQYWTCLKELILKGCSSLQSLQEIAGFTGLFYLELEGCPSLEHSMLEEIWKLTGLTHLDLIKWENIRALPDGLASMTRLRGLDLAGCTSLLCVPEEVTRLTSLVSLGLSGCKSLKCLPQGLSSLANLRLELSDCTSLVKEDTNLITDVFGYCDASRLYCDYPSLFQTQS